MEPCSTSIDHTQAPHASPRCHPRNTQPAVMERLVQPELLDHLPGDHPHAIRSHRDLRRIHAWMGNVRHVAPWLDAAASRSRPRRIIDLGAGDGAFLSGCLRHATRIPKGTELVLIDRRNSVHPGILSRLHARGFHPRVEQVEALEWFQTASPQPDTWILASLFLHHFETPSLQTLLAHVAQHASLFSACEPRRASLPLAACRLLPFIGANAVTRHDAAISVRAGFRGTELSNLWPVRNGWRLSDRTAGFFSQILFAERNAPA
jgi:hypothetical protein